MIVRIIAWLDARLGGASFARHVLRKAFPDHWSFMLGEINLYCFLILLATGTFLALNFDPSSAPVVYRGAATLFNGITVSTAYASALHLSFDINAGLLMRQIHHWAALVFVAAVVVHMGRVFLTGAFRRPREINWMIGILLLMLALFEGFAGYSLPGDLLSGLGLRIADAMLLSIPVIGTWISFWLFGGAFPSPSAGPRLFVAHVYIVPAIIGLLIGAHLALVWRQKHTQFAGYGRTENNVTGSPLFPHYTLRSLALGFGTLMMLAALGALVQINPVWIYGPYVPWQALSPSQPDWYLGWIEGALRLEPPWAIHIFGHLIPPPFWVTVLMPVMVFAFLFCWPFIERHFTRDDATHNILDHPRAVPLRTAIGVWLVTFAVVLTLAGSNDVQSRYTYLSVFSLTNAYRILVLVLPFVAGLIAYGIANELKQYPGGRSPRVRIYRTESGAYEEKPIP